MESLKLSVRQSTEEQNTKKRVVSIVMTGFAGMNALRLMTQKLTMKAQESVLKLDSVESVQLEMDTYGLIMFSMNETEKNTGRKEIR